MYHLFKLHTHKITVDDDRHPGLGRQAARARGSHRQGAAGLRAAHELRGTWAGPRGWASSWGCVGSILGDSHGRSYTYRCTHHTYIYIYTSYI